MTTAVFTAFLHKEWRSQRALLVSYLALTFLALGIVLPMLPRGLLGNEHDDAMAVGCFVIAGLVGAVLFAAPQCVLGEFHGRNDQFLTRMPGALLPAFAAKAVFVASAAAALLILGLGFGELALLLRGHAAVSPVDVLHRGPALMQVVPYGLLSLPWVLTLAFCLPGGRMAVGATALLALAIAFGIQSLYRSHVGMVATHPIFGDLPWVGVVGIGVAAIVGVHGRRGGGAWRAAKCAALGAVIGFLPQLGYLASGLIEYHWPDVARPVVVNTSAVTPDGRFALADITVHDKGLGVPTRIDLVTGQATAIAPMGSTLQGTQTWHERLPLRDLWGIETPDQVQFVTSLATGEAWPVRRDSTRQLHVPEVLQARLARQRATVTRLMQPDGRAAWLAEDRLWFAEADGSTTSVPFLADGPVVPMGHGFLVQRGGNTVVFDLARRQVLARPLPASLWYAFAVDGRWLSFAHADGDNEPGACKRWCWFDADTGQTTPCAKLTNNDLALGVLSRDTVLFARHGSREQRQLAAYRVTDGSFVALPLPEVILSAPQMYWFGFVQAVDGGLRDARGRVWLSVGFLGNSQGIAWVSVDPATLAVELQVESPVYSRPLVFLDERTLIAEEGRQRIVRIDLVTKARTVLFPRGAAEGLR